MWFHACGLFGLSYDFLRVLLTSFEPAWRFLVIKPSFGRFEPIPS